MLTLGADEKSDILQDFQSYTYYIYREKGSDAWIMQILLDVGDMVDMFYHDSRVNLQILSNFLTVRALEVCVTNNSANILLYSLWLKLYIRVCSAIYFAYKLSIITQFDGFPTTISQLYASITVLFF